MNISGVSLLLLSMVASPFAAASSSAAETTTSQQLPVPTIFDTDFGSFIDDIFAVGLLVQSFDVLDTKLIVTTSEHPEKSATCVSKQLDLSELGGGDRREIIPVVVGETLPDYEFRGPPCNVPDLLGFALEDECEGYVPQNPVVEQEHGVEFVAQTILESNRTDWTYIAVGGQTTLEKLIRDHPEAASRISNIVIMGGNWGVGFDPYPGVTAPVTETNVACDMDAANFVLDPFNGLYYGNMTTTDIWYVPVATAREFTGDEYGTILNATDNDEPSAKATIDFYRSWTRHARNDPSLLVHAEAMEYDPDVESTPQFDAIAVQIAMDVALGKAGNRALQVPFRHGVHFATAVEIDSNAFGEGKNNDLIQAAHSLWSGLEQLEIESMLKGHSEVYTRATGLTSNTFDAVQLRDGSVLSPSVPVQAAMGFVNVDAERDFFNEMASRIAGTYNNSSHHHQHQEQDQEHQQSSSEKETTMVEDEFVSSSSSSSANFLFAPLTTGFFVVLAAASSYLW